MPYESVSGAITMAFSGDAIVTRDLTEFVEPQFLRLRDIIRQGDVGFTNGETLFHNYEDPPGYFYGMFARCDPRHIRGLQWMGINLMSCANNHASDFGDGGVLANIRNLDLAGMAHAGTGRNYAEALAPAYLDTPRGRVGLVSATTTAHPHSRAGDQRRDLQGRPGTNLIRWVNEWTVEAESFRALAHVAERFGWSQKPQPARNRDYGLDDRDAGSVVQFLDRNALGEGTPFVEDPAARFVLGERFECHTKLHQADFERNLQSISEARRMADWVILSLHSHEGGTTVDDPAEHVQVLAHAAVDAGVDVVIGHGPHRDRGIEIYNGRPIFYSLGAFISQHLTIPVQPQDIMQRYGLSHAHSAADVYDVFAASRPEPEIGPGWWSAIPVVRFENHRVCEISLHPIELGFGRPRHAYGRPMLAEGDVARRALERFQKLSAPFGTRIDIDGETGVVSLD